jgi:gas vesicle protein
MTNHAHSDERDWQSNASSAVAWLLAGFAIGAAAALLLAPSTGRDLRSAFGRGFRRTLHALNRGTRQLRRRGANVIRFSRRSRVSGT